MESQRLMESERLNIIYLNTEELKNQRRLNDYERIRKYNGKFKFLTYDSITSRVIDSARVRTQNDLELTNN